MKGKWLIALVICLSIAATGALWASGGKEAAATTGVTTIDFMCNGGSVNQEMFKKWIDGFHAKNADIKVNYFPFPEGGWAKVMTMFAGEWQYTKEDGN